MASSRLAAPNLPNLSITSPLLRAKFFITKNAVWPSVVFQTNAVLNVGEQLTWEWSIKWERFYAHGLATTETPWWDAQSSVVNSGGLLTVSAKRGAAVCTSPVSVQILGEQPEPGDVAAYLAACPDSAGFDKILMHESKLRHFDAAGNPAKSFDRGFGMAQLTNPAPDFAQVWNWQLNIDAGLKLFHQKRTEALAYLSRRGTFTEQQVVKETISRWNGGSYHVWDAAQGWVRKPAILCDSKTGNIGWDMANPANTGRAEDELHRRDAASYSRPPGSKCTWGYFGVCYADSVLGQLG